MFEEARDAVDVMVDMKGELLEAGLSAQHVAMVLVAFAQGVKDLLKAGTKEAAATAVKEVASAGIDAAKAAVNRKWEEDRCRRSGWVGHFNNSFSLSKSINAQIHKHTGYHTWALSI